ncbi:MAG: hypothetical protein KC425_22090, partial [Anaerolineales bacterium]|nr:hypothetical protein [Anaerolineales bacterium]
SQARPDEVAPTADDASLNLALTIDTNLLQEVDLEASGGFLPDALGQQRTRISEGGAARLIWDGHAAGFDAAGLGGIDLTGSGLRDQLRLSVAAIADPVTARFTVYSDAGSASTVELRLTAVGDVRIPFGSFTAVSGAGADFGNVGALTLDLTGDVAGLQLSALAADSPLTATHTQEALADDVVAHAITLVNNSGRDLGAFTFHAPALGRGGQLVAGSVAASQGRALAGAEAAVALDGLANGESVTLAYREMRLLATVPATLILQNGDTPTGSNGLPVDAVNNPVTSGLGEPAFSGDFDAGTNDDEFVWHGAGIAMSSSGVMTDFSSIESNIGVGDSGKFIASPILSAGSLDGVWTHNGALLYEQDPAPGVPGQYVSFASRPFMIPNGTAYFVGGYTATPGGTTADRVLWEATDTITPVITPLIQGGDVISGLVVSTNGIDFDYFVSDNGAHMMAVLDMDTGSTLDDFFVYLDGNLIIQEGAPISATENWDNFDIVQINDIGNYIIAGDTDGAATSDEFIAYNGTILIREGDTIDGVTLTDSAFVRNASINNLNQAVYTWGYAGGGTEAMFHACDAANLANARLVLMTGDQVDLDGNGSPDATITDFNAVQGSQYFTFAEDGRIYTEVDLDYGAGAVEAVIGVDAPSCTLGLSFAKTVGTDPGVCAAGSSLDILAGTDVYYCYEVMNTGAVTMTLHDLADDQLGAILSGFAYDLGPGASVFVTQTANITQTTTNTAIWTAYNPGPTDVVSATAAATVNVVPPTIALNKTVGTDPSACASSSSIVTGPNTDVTYCYEVTNAGLITLTLHDLVDTELGTILSGLAYDLGPGASVFVTQTANITQTTVNTATWTAYNAGPTDVATASASATVVVVPTAPLTCNGPTVGFDLGIPGGWNVVNNAPGNPVVWTNVAGSGEAGNYATGSGDAASASSDLQGGGSGLYDTELWTSPIDLSGVSQATFSYWANYGNFAFIDFLDLDVSTDGGATWTNLLRWNEDHHPNGLRNAPGEFVSIDLSAYTGQSNVILRWHYYDPAGPATSQDWYAQVDDVSLSCLSGTLGVSLNKTVGTDPSVCATTDTITVKGGTDAYYCYEVTNTGTVTVTMHDLDDDKLGNVFSSVAYDLAPGASIDTVALGLTISATINTTTTNTATWTGYVGTYTAVATDTATVNTTVPAAQLDTTSISETLSVGGMTDVIMTLDNTGSDDLSWTLVEEAAARGASRDIGTAWETMAPLPSARVFSAVVADASGYVYAIGGTSDAGALTPTDTVFRYDTATNTWATMAAMPAALDSIDGIVIKDKIYIPGGDLDNNTYVYDIATDSWSTIATNNGFTG